MSQESAAAYLRHGMIPFFRLPTTDDPDAWAGRGAVLLGVPWDGGTTYRPGARLAPWEIRRVSALVPGFHPLHGFDVFTRLGPVDGGNVPLSPFDAARMRANVEGACAAVLAAGAVPFLVGGDHAIALPALRAATKDRGPIAVIHVDAHFDTSGPDTWGETYHHGSPFRNALEEGLIAPGGLIQVGQRGARGSMEDEALVAAHGVNRYSLEAIARRGVARAVGAIRRDLGQRPVWLSFDIDAVDPAFAPGTGTPVPGGLAAREALLLIRGLAGVDLVGMDLVEVCPPHDHADVTANLAAHLLYEGLSLAAVRRAPPKTGHPASSRPCPGVGTGR